MTDTAVDTRLAGSREQVVAVSDTLVELLRSFGRARARLIAATHDTEWSAHVLLKYLRNEGPMRAGELAECLHTDPSTVSRQVAALVRDGLLERRADPEDGRASLLVLTSKADATLADHDRIRVDFFARVLDDWTPGELDTFTRLLARFTADFEQAGADELTERIAGRASAPAAAMSATDEGESH
jgi:DNA-binding MarR family transcriptional regulator